MEALLRALWSDESGQALVEYGMVIGLVAVALIAAAVAFRDQIANLFTRVGGQLNTVAPAS